MHFIFSHSRLELRGACINVDIEGLSSGRLIRVQGARLESRNLWTDIQSGFSSTCATTLQFSRLVIDLNEISLALAVSRFNLVPCAFNNWDLLFLEAVQTLGYCTHILSISRRLTSPIYLWNSFFANTGLTKAMVYFHLIFWAFSRCGSSFDEVSLDLCLSWNILRKFASRASITHGVHMGSSKWIVVSFWNRFGWRNR